MIHSGFRNHPGPVGMTASYPNIIVRSLFLVFVSLFAGLFPAYGQVSIAPTALFMEDRSPFATLTVANGSETAQEISLSFRFGYSISDSTGNLTMDYDVGEHDFALNDYVNAFPRNFTLEPGERQTVRLAARGLSNREEGTYWTRLAVLASPLSPPIGSLEDNAVTTRININFEQIIPVFFRRGQVTTGLDVDNIRFVQSGERGELLYDIQRTGNSPFTGSFELRILNGEEEPVVQRTANITTYYDMTRSMSIDLSELDAGEYTAELIFTSDRRDISRDNLIQIEPVRRTKTFSIE